MKNAFSIIILLLLFQLGLHAQNTQFKSGAQSSYLDYSNRDDNLSGGIKLIPITTPAGEFYRILLHRIG